MPGAVGWEGAFHLQVVQGVPDAYDSVPGLVEFEPDATLLSFISPYSSIWKVSARIMINNSD